MGSKMVMPGRTFDACPVAGDDHCVNAIAYRGQSQRSDHVIRFEAGLFDHRNAHRLEQLADYGNCRKRSSGV